MMRKRRDSGTTRTNDAGAASPGPRIEQEARRRLGRNLRLLYASVLSQPLPDRFTRLLDDLSTSTPARSDDNSREGA